jgi:PHP family Zn ribbon phosphoesterase
MLKGPSTGVRDKQPFLGIHFKCCNVYARIYRDKDATAYVGRCPRCGAAVRVPIGKGGSPRRFFAAE